MENELLQVQAFKEVTWGTPGTFTAKLMGIQDITIKPNVETVVHKDRRGSFQPGHMANVRLIDGMVTIESLLLYEDGCYWLDMLFGVATPGGSGPYTRDYALPTGSAPTIRTQSLIYGETGSLERVHGQTLQKAVFHFPRTGELTVSLESIAEQVDDDGALAALSDRTVAVAMAADATLFMDAWGGTVGSTEVTATAWSADVTVDARRELKHKPGQLIPYGYRHRGFDAGLKLRLEANATTLALQAAVQDATTGAPVQRQFRLKATRDTSADEKLFQVDFAGTFLNASEVYPDEDGLSMVEFDIGATYNATLGNSVKVATKNGVSALP